MQKHLQHRLRLTSVCWPYQVMNRRKYFVLQRKSAIVLELWFALLKCCMKRKYRKITSCHLIFLHPLTLPTTSLGLKVRSCWAALLEKRFLPASTLKQVLSMDLRQQEFLICNSVISSSSVTPSSFICDTNKQKKIHIAFSFVVGSHCRIILILQHN